MSSSFFVFLSKRLSPGLPSGGVVTSLAFEPRPPGGRSGLLAVGGACGGLRLLQLTGGAGGGGLTAATAVASGESLPAHVASLHRLAWADGSAGGGRFASSDSNGLVIVWCRNSGGTAGAGAWAEEMSNERGGRPRSISWRRDGEVVAIAGEDGHVLLGSVSGERLWSLAAGEAITHAAWAPDGRHLLLASANGSVTAFSAALGTRMGQLPTPSLNDLLPGNSRPPIVALDWHAGGGIGAGACAACALYPDAPALAVAWANGRVQLMRDADDGAPVILDTGLRLSAARWSCDGAVLAVAGVRPATAAAAAAAVAGSGTGSASSAEVQFYSPFGRFLSSLRVPGGAVAALDWEPGSLRLALAVDSYVYVANVRPAYTWAAFGTCVVYAHMKASGGIGGGGATPALTFWNTVSGERHTRPVPRLIAVHGAGAHCVVVSGMDPEAAEEDGAAQLAKGATAIAAAPAAATLAPAASGTRGIPACSQYALALCDALGAPLLTKTVTVRPDFVAMSTSHVAVAAGDALVVWRYEVAVAAAAEGAVGAGGAAAEAAAEAAGDEQALQLAGAAADHVCALAVSPSYLLVARESGSVQLFALPGLTPTAVFSLARPPASVTFNCDSTRFAAIDAAGALTLFDVDARGVDAAGAPTRGAALAGGERRDVWQVVWAADAPDLAAVMEKARMYILRGAEPEEPASSAGYICRFDDLTTTSVLLDDVEGGGGGGGAASAALVLRHETRSLRDARMLLARAVSLRDCATFIEDNAHPRLWRLLADAALDAGDLATAERACIGCADVGGLRFIARLRALPADGLQGAPPRRRAATLAFLGRGDEAEALLLAAGRRDLAIEARTRAGDWAQVLRLLEGGGGAHDDADTAALTAARARVGDHFADRGDFCWAIPLYAAAGRLDALVECYYRTDDFAALEGLVDALPPRSPALAGLGAKLASVGLAAAAARAYERAGDAGSAVDAAASQGHWARAVALADAHGLPQADSLAAVQAARLVASRRPAAAADFLRSAGRRSEAAHVLAAAAAAASTAAQTSRRKRLLVLAAREAEGAAAAAGVPPPANAWHGAEALHFLLLAQRHLLAGDAAAALAAAARASLYQLAAGGPDAAAAAAILALAAAHAGAYGACSRALTALQPLAGSDAPALAGLALAIFARTRPIDAPGAGGPDVVCPGFEAAPCGAPLRAWATDCLRCGAAFPACVATGTPLFLAATPGGVSLHDNANARKSLPANLTRCAGCRRLALRSAVTGRASCPLCHAAVAL